MKKTLIAYYSHSGTTKRVAEQINQMIDGDLFEIIESDPYPRDYNTVVNQAKQEINNGFKPNLKDAIPDVSGYDIIMVGSPNWWSTIAPPVATFLSEADLAGKTIATFITHGGGGLGHTVDDIRKLCPDAEVAEGFNANRTGQIAEWLKTLGIA